MNLHACPRESEVKVLVERGQWPHACPPDLYSHVAGCKSCGELVLVTSAFQQMRNQAVGTVRLGSPGLLWWRAQLRRRNAAVERISRPILSAQIFALGLSILLALAVAGWQARNGLGWLTWLERLPRNFDSQWISWLVPAGIFNKSPDSFLSPLVLIAAASAAALVGCVVVYFASEKQ